MSISTPTTKNTYMRPIVPRNSTAESLATRLSAWGPMRMPARARPTMPGQAHPLGEEGRDEDYHEHHREDARGIGQGKGEGHSFILWRG